VKAGTDPDALPAVPAVRSLGQIPDLVKTLGLTF
jgi:hypothetical protein